VTAHPGEVHLADIFEGGVRPVIIVSREPLNRGGLFLAVPTTSSRVAERRRYRNYVFLPAGAGGLREDSVAVTHLVQPVRAPFLRNHWGVLSDAFVQQVLLGIAWSVRFIDA
jgi:mRNA-degrading endonuclease toxin of MazEF toxin-antitoxin module